MDGVKDYNEAVVFDVVRRRGPISRLLCQLKRRFKPTTDSGHSFRTYPNLIKNATLDRPDQGQIADITYVQLPTSSCYLASMLGGFSRYCVGWSLSRWIDPTDPLCSSDGAGGPPSRAGIDPPLRQSRAVCQGPVHGKARRGRRPDQHVGYRHPYENTRAEGFFRNLKMEKVYLKDYRTFEEAEQNIRDFIGEVYNRKRLHSSLGYMPPVEFEADYALKARS